MPGRLFEQLSNSFNVEYAEKEIVDEGEGGVQ